MVLNNIRVFFLLTTITSQVFSASDEKCLAVTVTKEAGNQSYLGKMAVISVVFNRSKIYNKSVCEVVTQKGQFVWYKSVNDLSVSVDIGTAAMVRQSLKDRREGKFVDYTNGATHFHTRNSKPYWSHPKHTVKLATIGDHHFYKVRENT